MQNSECILPLIIFSRAVHPSRFPHGLSPPQLPQLEGWCGWEQPSVAELPHRGVKGERGVGSPQPQPQPCQELPTMLPTGVPWPRQPWLSIPSHPSQHRQPLGRAEARREERKGTESRGGRGGVVKEANKKNKTTERLLHSPRLNYKPVY